MIASISFCCEKSERVLSPSRRFREEMLGDGFLGSPGSTDHRENIRLEHWDTDRARWSLGYYPFFIVLLFAQLAIFSPPRYILVSPLPFIFFSFLQTFLLFPIWTNLCLEELFSGNFLWNDDISCHLKEVRIFRTKNVTRSRIYASITLSKYIRVHKRSAFTAISLQTFTANRRTLSSFVPCWEHNISENDDWMTKPIINQM